MQKVVSFIYDTTFCGFRHSTARIRVLVADHDVIDIGHPGRSHPVGQPPAEATRSANVTAATHLNLLGRSPAGFAAPPRGGAATPCVTEDPLYPPAMGEKPFSPAGHDAFVCDELPTPNPPRERGVERRT